MFTSILKYAFVGTSLIGLAACKDAAAPDAKPANVTVKTATASYPLAQQFECLPADAAFVAAHRGVSKGEGYAENSGGSLKALIDKGILFAEIDVAGLKDGTHILYHDGVWEEKSTGNGVVPASNWADAEKILLRDTDGNLVSERPIKLDDVLSMAKDNLYLEVDFKSSAKYETVIESIRKHGMADRVILIAYNEGQAGRLAKLAPEMAQSVTLKSEADIKAHEAAGVSRNNMNAWLWRGPFDPGFMAMLAANDIPVLAWPNREDVAAAAKPASLIVSDYAFGFEPIIGMTDSGWADYQTCLDKG